MRLLAWDTETYLITATDKAPKGVCCSWWDGDRQPWITHPGDLDTFALWSDPNNAYVGTNIAYDIVSSMRWQPHLTPYMIQALDEGRVFDVAVREALMHLAQVGRLGFDPQMSLKKLVAKYLGKDISASKEGEDIWRMKFGTLDGVPFNSWPVEAVQYVLEDARHPFQVFQMQGGIDNVQPTEMTQVQAATVLHAIGTWGFAIDQGTRGKLKETLTTQAVALEKQIGHLQLTGPGSQGRMFDLIKRAWWAKHTKTIARYAENTGVAFDAVAWEQGVPKDTQIKAWIEYLASQRQILPCLTFPPGTDAVAWMGEVYEMLLDMPETKKGPSTSEESLEMVGDEIPDAKAYVELKHKGKMLSTYIDPYEDPTIHPRFVPIVTTGRIGCREPNTTNIPRKDKTRPEEAFRTMFAARPKRKLGTVDYSQLELCTLSASIRAMFPHIPCKMGEAIDKNVDLHCVTASFASGLSYEQLMAKKKIEGSPEAGYRQTSKIVNFGRGGGMGMGAFMHHAKGAYGVDIDFKETQRFFRAFDQAWPEIPMYLKNIGSMVSGAPGGKVVADTIWGQLKAGCSYTECANFRFQALAAHGAKAALWDVWRECMLGWYWANYQGNGYGSEYSASPLQESRLVNFVHDEIVAEHPEDARGEAALKRQEALMIEAMHRTCKRLVTIRVEGKLSDRWEH